MTKEKLSESLRKVSSDISAIQSERETFSTILTLAGNDDKVKSKINALRARHDEDFKYLVAKRERLVFKALMEKPELMEKLIAQLSA